MHLICNYIKIFNIYFIPLVRDAEEIKVYIGMTREKFKDRLKEIISDTEFNRKLQRYRA